MCVCVVYVCVLIQTFICTYVRDSWGSGAARQTHLAQRTFVDKRHLTPVFGMKLESDSVSESEPESSPARRHCVRLLVDMLGATSARQAAKDQTLLSQQVSVLRKGQGRVARGDDDDAGAHSRLCHILLHVPAKLAKK